MHIVLAILLSLLGTIVILGSYAAFSLKEMEKDERD